jgi:hypothetical protein
MLKVVPSDIIGCKADIKVRCNHYKIQENVILGGEEGKNLED